MEGEGASEAEETAEPRVRTRRLQGIHSCTALAMGGGAEYWEVRLQSGAGNGHQGPCPSVCPFSALFLNRI